MTSAIIAEPILGLAVPIDRLNADPSNARQHNEKNLKAIKASLSAFGQRKPIVVQKSGMIVRAGNGTLAAAKALGWTEIAAVVMDDDNATAMQFAIADNRTGELAEWNSETLAALLDGMDDKTRSMLAFDDKDLRDLLHDIGRDVVEDEAPDPPGKPETEAGQIVLLGAHRLLCGDSTSSKDVERLMQGKMASAVITDPPYGVSYVGKTRDALRVENDGADGLRQLLHAAMGNAALVCLDGGCWYVAAPAGPQFLDFAVVLSDLKVWRQTLVWVKDCMVLGRSDYHYRHEAIFYGWKPGKAHMEPPDRKQTTVWEFDRPKASREHPTMKPVALYAKMLENSTSVGSVVYEPFGGSGTTLIAAEQMGRVCHAMEIAPAYCDVIIQRWETLTGKKAVRHGVETT